MTDHTNAELIADVRNIDSEWVLDNSPDDSVETIRELAAALEAAEQRAEKAEGERDLFKREQVRLAARCDQAQNERNEYAAVVEKALSHDPLHGADSGLHCGGMAPCIRHILATAPADALREHEAALIEELATEWEELVQREKPPKRGSLWLREKARQRREEQS